MQLFLPVFPKTTTPISACVDVFEHDNVVQYFAGAAPVYSHSVNDQPYFRFVVSNLVERHLCTQTEVSRCFGVSTDSVSKWYKWLKNEGPSAFFGPDGRHGKAHKITGERLERIQKKLDKGQSNNSIAKEEGITESAIRYAISVGHLKKKALVTESATSATEASTANERNEADASAPMGIATTRYEERSVTALGMGGHAPALGDPAAYGQWPPKQYHHQ